MKNSSRFEKGNIPWNKDIKIDRLKYPKFGHFVLHNKEAKEKMRNSHLNVKFSISHKKSLSDSHKGIKPWNIGLTKETDNRIPDAWNKGKKGYKIKRIESAWNKNIPQTETVKDNLRKKIKKMYDDDPIYRLRVSDGVKKAMKRPEVKENMMKRPEQKISI